VESTRLRGHLHTDGEAHSFDPFEVAPVAERADFAERLRAFLAAPNVTLLLPDKLVVIPSGSIREFSITRTTIPEDQLADIPRAWGAFCLGSSRLDRTLLIRPDRGNAP
jgi:hypothetical protein